MGYDIKKVKVWGVEYNPLLVGVVTEREREEALFSIVKELFDEFAKCPTGEVYIRCWPVLTSLPGGGYKLTVRLAADGWLDPGYKPQISPKECE